MGQRPDAEFVRFGRCESSIWVRGTFTPGDYAAFRDLLAGEGKYAVDVKLIQSTGGNLEEAMKMGRLIRKLGMRTQITDLLLAGRPAMLSDDVLNDSDATCASACVAVWLFGIWRMGDWRLLIHRPYYDSSYFSKLSVVDADARYDEPETEFNVCFSARPAVASPRSCASSPASRNPPRARCRSIAAG